ncbi:DUF3422 family protein [Paracoccus fistulariae]|uniref:DUF3422 domain-containing protein n=1 Tax=Paracoccus fistulariae TaxID=658446 RepID=A0ABY7SMX5_9RHOB|nr:DUF3422 domain-containing protein [Paracoccus fistulariae]MDB6179805.1 DUF3422 domain-containing protein [Paracoccus fistulariae]WCR07913.1 DUF3422 domain-containing protein [Paracoccus fistulariae]
MGPATEHPQRYELVNELHARPSPRISAPSTTVFVAFKELRGAANRAHSHDMAHLSELTTRHGGPRPDPDDSHYQGQLGRHALKWESHTEFVTYMATTSGLPIRPFDPSAAAIFPKEWQLQAPGKRVAAVMVQVDLLPDDPADALAQIADWFAPDSLTAVWVLEEAAMIATDFRIDANGWMRFAMFVRPGVGPGRTGRLVHRLVELETYRAMSMLGLGRARELTRRLNELEVRLTAIVEGMNDETRPGEAVLHDLLSVSAQLEAQAVQHSFRFGATAAYQAIVTDRIEALRETRFMGRQMLTEFMRRRYLPAMRTTASAEARLRSMLERTTRAAELLRTRVDVERSAQNQELMTRMDRRADLQLRLQHTVEGLSVVAISYYAVGLLSYALYPLAARLSVDKSYLIAGLTPLVVLAVWWSMRQIRKRLHRHAPDADF